MDCAAARRAIELHLDGELPEAERPALEAHLRGCGPCASAALAGRELREAIRDASSGSAPRPALQARVARALGRRSPRPMYLLAAAAVLLLAASLAALVATRGARREALLGELLDLHAAALPATAALDVVSTDAHTVKPWFEGKVPFTFDLPDLAGSPFTLLGARQAWVDEAPAVQLLFGVRRHRVSVFVLPERAAAGFASAAGRARSFRVATFTGPGVRYVAVSDTAPEDVAELVRLFTVTPPGSRR